MDFFKRRGGAALKSQREAAQTELDVLEQEVEALRERKEDIENKRQRLRKSIDMQRNGYLTEKMAAKSRWTRDMEDLKREQDEMKATLKMERERVEGETKLMKEEIGRLREETEEQREQLRTGHAMLDAVERERRNKQEEVEATEAKVRVERDESLTEDAHRIKELWGVEWELLRVEEANTYRHYAHGKEIHAIRLQHQTEMGDLEKKRDKRVQNNDAMRREMTEELERMKANALREATQEKDQLQNEMERLREEARQSKALLLREKASIEEKTKREREELVDECRGQEAELENVKKEKELQQIRFEKLLKELEGNYLKEDEMEAQWAKCQALHRKWWAMEKEVINERKLVLESEIMTSRRQWQMDRLTLRKEKKDVENRRRNGAIARWFQSLICCNRQN
ncbi:hypothetical protein AAFF_G00014960 [Aldrovandia affinis]|uniref:Uncharacterized protein n=1 Tax=Aldrovandia affinis TaxID=143900 RepID=A0AAD7WH69_9TELE|nr:hypothetical protein AAFF_G00014960 [Aldrovandia affinis]